MYLGEPMEIGYFVTGEHSDRETEVNYTVSGPLNSADVYLYAEVINGHWVIQDLELTVNKINKKIDVLTVY